MLKSQSANRFEDLLRAAEYLDSCDKEHGYASTSQQMSDNGEDASSSTSAETKDGSVENSKRTALKSSRIRSSFLSSSIASGKKSTLAGEVTKKSRQNNRFVRSAHNELEKSRRASMRGCLEALRMLLPNEHLERTSTGKNTTLSVLRSARTFIKALHECLDHKVDTKSQLMSEQSKKLQRLSQLSGANNPDTKAQGSKTDNKLETLGTVAAALSKAEGDGGVESKEKPTASNRIETNRSITLKRMSSTSPPAIVGPNGKGSIKIVKCVDPDRKNDVHEGNNESTVKHVLLIATGEHGDQERKVTATRRS